MALRRIVAGPNPGQVGLLSNLADYFSTDSGGGSAPIPIVDNSLSAPTTTAPATGGALTITNPSTVTILPPGTTWGSGQTVQQMFQPIQDAFAALDQEYHNRYNYLLSTSPYDLTQAGYYVSDDGYVWLWTDAAHTKSTVYLQLDTIQGIENAAGTAGALFMHMGLPLIAKDTAGYGGGTRASTGATTMYSTPIPEVQAIPTQPTGPNVIQDYTPPASNIPPPTTQSGGTTTTTTPPTTTPPGETPPQTTAPSTAGQSSNLLGLVGLGLAALAVARDRKLLLAGGLGLLYYSISKNKTA